MNPSTTTIGFAGATVALFESRMGEAMAKSIASHGGVPLPAPAMREVPLAGHAPVASFGQQLLAGQIDVLICLTGVGARMLLEALTSLFADDRCVAALRRTTVVARGPKPIRVLKEYGIPVTLSVPEPNTWQEILQTLDFDERSLNLSGRTVAIQEHGAMPQLLIEALQARGARVLRVPVYRWALPEDTQPLERAIRAMLDGRAPFALFTNAVQVRHVMDCARGLGLEERLREACGRIVIGSIGPTTSEELYVQGLHVDFEPAHGKMGPLIDELARCAAALLEARRVLQRVVPKTAAVPQDRSRRVQSPFLKACRREAAPVTPIWLMRQAGRYMQEYREIRSRLSFLELCKRPELVAEVTVTAAERLGADAAILFSDILVIVEPLGLGLEYNAGEGPVISGPVTSGADIDQLRELALEPLEFVFEGIRQTRAALRPELPLIGFAGAPFTLASYILEGGSSKLFLETKRLMYADPGAWHALMEKISRGLVRFLNGQIAAGVDAVQLFDSWVGCLSPHDYREFVLPHTQRVLQGLNPGVPIIHFGTGTAAFLRELRQAGGDVIGVDFRVSLQEAWRTIGYDRGIQGNLDPVALYAPVPVIRQQVQRILDEAAGRPGHIFNLGHGILPTTPVDHVRALVDLVHELSRR
jgi:uroporphyrinogen decarboxylase